MVKKSLNLRLTIIDADGTVVAESHKDKTKMDNHKYRDEIMQANEEDFGYKIRRSKTINKDLLYIAKKYTTNNKTTYIRMAKEFQNINQAKIKKSFPELSERNFIEFYKNNFEKCNYKGIR